jgi:hypothetical protein
MSSSTEFKLNFSGDRSAELDRSSPLSKIQIGSMEERSGPVAWSRGSAAAEAKLEIEARYVPLVLALV